MYPKLAWEVKYERLVLQAPIGKQKKYPALTLTVIHVQETIRPKGRERIDWKLIDYQSVHPVTKGCPGETVLVRHAMEDRDLPQNPKIRLQGETRRAARLKGSST